MSDSGDMNIYDSLFPIYAVLRIFGSAPFSQTSTSTQFQTGFRDLILSIVNIVAFTYFCLLNLDLSLFYPIESIILNYSTKIVINTGMLYAIQCIVYLFLVRQDTVIIGNALHDFDLKLEFHKIKIDYPRHRSYVLWNMTSAFLVMSCIIAVKLFLFNRVGLLLELRAMYIAHAYLSIFITVIVKALIIPIRFVSERFYVLNKYLSDIFHVDYHRKDGGGEAANILLSKSESSIDEFEYNLMKLSRQYDRLLDVIDRINSVYAIQIMIATACNFGYSILALFSFYQSIVRYEVKVAAISFSLYAWNCFYNFIVFEFVYNATRLIKEAEHTRILIRKALCNLDDERLIKRLKALSQRLEHQPPMITCRLFDFTWATLCSMSAALTTYLLIFIQFDVYHHHILAIYISNINNINNNNGNNSSSHAGIGIRSDTIGYDNKTV